MAVDELRNREGLSIEQIMLDQVQYYRDGLGVCTRVDCLLHAATEAARIFIFEQRIKQEQNAADRYAWDSQQDHYEDDYHYEMKGSCEERCMMEMSTVRFTDDQAMQAYMEDCMGMCHNEEKADEINLRDFAGHYENVAYEDHSKNDWHFVDLTPTEDGYKWTNDAGASWSLRLRPGQSNESRELWFNVGEDCPYYADGYTETKLVMRQGEFIIFGPGREPYVMQYAFEDGHEPHTGGEWEHSGTGDATKDEWGTHEEGKDGEWGTTDDPWAKEDGTTTDGAWGADGTTEGDWGKDEGQWGTNDGEWDTTKEDGTTGPAPEDGTFDDSTAPRRRLNEDGLPPPDDGTAPPEGGDPT